MNSSLCLARPPAGHDDLARAIRSLPPATGSGLVMVAVVCAFFAVIEPAMGSAVPVERLASPQAIAEVASPTKARAKFRCGSCGVVEALHRTDAIGDTPASYEFTVRMRDGSSRISSDVHAGKWHIGDQIMLIGDTAPRK